MSLREEAWEKGVLRMARDVRHSETILRRLYVDLVRETREHGAPLPDDHRTKRDLERQEKIVAEQVTGLEGVARTQVLDAASAPRTGEGLENAKQAITAIEAALNDAESNHSLLAPMDDTEDFKAADKRLRAAWSGLGTLCALLASPSTESVGGWSYDMEAGKVESRSEDLLLAFMEPGSVKPYRDFGAFYDGHWRPEPGMVFRHEPFAWLRIAPPPLPDDQGGEG